LQPENITRPRSDQGSQTFIEISAATWRTQRERHFTTSPTNPGLSRIH